MNVKLALIGLTVATLSAPVFAQSTDTKAAAPAAKSTATDTKSTPRIDERQANQEKRIEQGVKPGELTKKETVKLDKGQAKVQKMENKAVADGKVTTKEKKHIEHAQDQQSKKIAREKHDNQTVTPTAKSAPPAPTFVSSTAVMTAVFESVKLRLPVLSPPG